MARRLTAGETLVMASHNKGKLVELAALVAPFGLTVVSAGSLGLPEPEETGDTFEANATLKAVAAATASGLPALSDDSGLSVEALGGAPGIYSARWAGPDKDFDRAMATVEERLLALGATTPETRRAAFVAVLCLAFPDGTSTTWRGEVHGHLVYPPRGGNGFGYDPVFIPDGEERTFGEMSRAEKETMSHRARAFALFAGAALP
ncbi:MAG TPA: RdgB/HAM1 family non-canonical purine NTP pyrophosphatase [Bauldia sp.]|nr:RdgB/HAM1 family non-canonical purine NTP pyrophosphatase [Bauldia sp.]